MAGSVTTPTPKSDGFSSNVCGNPLRWRLTAMPWPFFLDQYRADLIARQRQPTDRTLMPSILELFGDALFAYAGLTRAVGVDRDDLTASFFRFARQDCDKLSPPHIVNRCSKMTVLDHVRDRQVFVIDRIIGVHERPCRLVVDVAAGVGDLLVQQRHAAPYLAPTGAPALTARQCPLSHTEVTARLLKRGVDSRPSHRYQWSENRSSPHQCRRSAPLQART